MRYVYKTYCVGHLRADQLHLSVFLNGRMSQVRRSVVLLICHLFSSPNTFNATTRQRFDQSVKKVFCLCVRILFFNDAPKILKKIIGLLLVTHTRGDGPWIIPIVARVHTKACNGFDSDLPGTRTYPSWKGGASTGAEGRAGNIELTTT